MESWNWKKNSEKFRYSAKWIKLSRDYPKQLKIRKWIKKKILELNNINDLKQQYLFKQSVEQKIKEILKLIEQTKTKLEKLRLDLLEAQKNRKIMEKLKEKDYIEYKENLMLEEQKELDEIAVFRYGAAGEM